jgi:hypothetical protein
MTFEVVVIPAKAGIQCGNSLNPEPDIRRIDDLKRINCWRLSFC